MNKIEENNKLNKDNAIYIFENIKSFINMADKKVSISLGLAPLITGILSYMPVKSLIGNVVIGSMAPLQIATLVLVIMTFASLVCAIICFVYTLFPNFKGMNKEKNQLSLTFYGDIKQHLSENDFLDFANSKGNRGFENDILKNIYNNSHVAFRKMKNFRIGLIFMIISINLAIESICICLFL